MTDDQTARFHLHEALLALGFVAGTISRPEVFAALTETIRDGTLHQGHVVFLRDRLTLALQEAGVEGGSPEAVA
jgi:hypothetical protein